MKDDKRIRLTLGEIAALEQWLTICETRLHFMEVDGNKYTSWWTAQYNAASKYAKSTMDGKASPMVYAYIKLAQDLMETDNITPLDEGW